MEPISLIIAAVIAGATTAAGDVATSAVKDVYSGLKTLLKRRFSDSGDHTAESELEAASPNEERLRSALESSGAATDQEIIEKAKAVMLAKDPEGAAAGKYNVHISGGIVGNVGDGNTANIGVPPSS
jgi:hypothetical protein